MAHAGLWTGARATHLAGERLLGDGSRGDCGLRPGEAKGAGRNGAILCVCCARAVRGAQEGRPVWLLGWRLPDAIPTVNDEVVAGGVRGGVGG